MSAATFRFRGELADFLPRERRESSFDYGCARAATLKNAIEALGVPHTEIGAVRVNGRPATLARIVRDNDEVEVFPWSLAESPQALPRGGFVADAHLGGLARFLRMLGFDTVHHNGITDVEIRKLAHEDGRLALSRDRELLKCRDVVSGCYVHAKKPEAQLREVADRFALAAHARPFTLCLACNLSLQPVDKPLIASRLPERVAATQDRFMRCPGCDRVYWPGSHYRRMQAVLGRLVPGSEPA
jgi:uncharacterized protein with PIN domain/sulfur carrier protein ThiS